jgi:hypothetical protein
VIPVNRQHRTGPGKPKRLDVPPTAPRFRGPDFCCFRPTWSSTSREDRNARREQTGKVPRDGGAVQRKGRLLLIMLVPFLDQGREPRAHGREESRLRIACGHGDEVIGQGQTSPERAIGPSFRLLPARPRRSLSMRTTSKGKLADPPHSGTNSGFFDLMQSVRRVCRPFLSQGRGTGGIGRAGLRRAARPASRTARTPRASRSYAPVDMRQDQRRYLLFQANLLRFRAFPVGYAASRADPSWLAHPSTNARFLAFTNRACILRWVCRKHAAPGGTRRRATL